MQPQQHGEILNMWADAKELSDINCTMLLVQEFRGSDSPIAD